MTTTAAPAAPSRTAVALHHRWTYGILSIADHGLRLRMLLAVRRLVQRALAMLGEDIDLTVAEWLADGASYGDIGAAMGVRRSTVQGHVRRGDRLRTDRAATGPARLQQAGAVAAQTE